MKIYKKEILGIEVFFAHIHGKMGWFFTLNGKDYGAITTIESNNSETTNKIHFDVLEMQATENIESLLKKND